MKVGVACAPVAFGGFHPRIGGFAAAGDFGRWGQSEGTQGTQGTPIFGKPASDHSISACSAVEEAPTPPITNGRGGGSGIKPHAALNRPESVLVSTIKRGGTHGAAL
jgi:hypothetical protein